MAVNNWQSGRRRPNQLYMLGGRVWQGLLIMEYYQAMVRSPNARLKRRIQARSWFRLQPFGATEKDFKCGTFMFDRVRYLFRGEIYYIWKKRRNE